MILRPSKVKNSLTSSIVADSPAIRTANPPVAITFGFDFTSFFMRLTISSTKPTYPKKIPDCMLCVVFLPTIVFGLTISTRGSFEAR